MGLTVTIHKWNITELKYLLTACIPSQNMKEHTVHRAITTINKTDLHKGRTQCLSAKTMEKIATYFSVSTDYLLGATETKKAPAVSDERSISDADLKFALWGDCTEIDDDDLDDVRRYAAFLRERKKAK